MRVARTAEDIAECQSLRRNVFVVEQQIPADTERDGKDQDAFHIMLCLEECLVATGRVLVKSAAGGPAKAILGRIAVRTEHRGQGLGSRVVQELETLARAEGAAQATLSPHHYLEPFYARMGYQRPSGDEIINLTDRHLLITMEKGLDAA